MLSPLLPQQRLPVVRSKLAPPLRAVLRVANAIMGAVGLATLAFGLFMKVHYLHPDPGPEPGPDPPPGPFPPEAVVVSPTKWGAATLAGARQLLSLSAPENGSPWFVHLVLGTGAYLIVTALTGMCGLRSDQTRRLMAFIILTSGALLAQAAALVVLFSSEDWRERVPPESSGWWQCLLDYITVDANARVVKIVGLTTMLAEMVVLGAACWLHAIYMAAHEAWLDDVEDARERARDVFGRAAERLYSGRGGGGAAWSTRMRDKYGVDAAAWEASAQRARQVAVLADDPPAAWG